MATRRRGQRCRTPHPLLALRLPRSEQPSPLDDAYYRERVPEIAGSDIVPLVHFVTIGAASDRETHPLFDPGFYREQLAAPVQPVSALEHYLVDGYRLETKPHPLFDPDHYRRQCDGEDEAENPLVHFVRFGRRERKSPHPLFDPAYYLSQRSDIVAAGADPFVHFLEFGHRESVKPHPLFDSTYYREQVEERLQLNENILIYYLRDGYRGDDKPHPLFDPAFYRDQLTGEERDENPLLHYLSVGYLLDLKPHPLFDPAYYVAQRSDLAAKQVEPLTHYLQFGYRENLKPHRLLDMNYYADHFAGGTNPLEHFVRHGLSAGISPTWQGARGGFFHRLVCESLRGGDFAQAKIQDRALMNLDLWADVKSVAGPMCRIVSVADSVTTLRAARTYDLPAVRVLGGVDWPTVSTMLPAHQLAQIDDVIAVGGTRLVVSSGGDLLYDEMSDPDGEQYAMKLPFMRAFADGRAVGHFECSRRSIAAGVLLSSDADFNYFHWMLEALPKVELVSAAISPRVPMLVSQRVPRTGLNALRRLIGDRPIVRVRDNIGYRVDRLYAPTDRSRIVNNYERPVRPDYDILIDPGAIDYLRTRLLPAQPATPTRKIFISRTSGMRRLLNERRLSTLLARQGFISIDPGRLGFEEQLELWSDAAVIIAPTGAALANLVFAHPGARILIIASQHSQTNLHLFTQIATHIGLDVAAILGPRAFKINNQYSVHDDYSVDVEAVLAWESTR